MRRNGHKYHAKRTEVDGHKFASLKEARRYQELLLLEKAGVIRKLKLQPSFELHVATMDDDEPLPKPAEFIGRYRGDFSYETSYTVRAEGQRQPIVNWCCVVEDVKGFKTPLYKWKKKHVEAQYGIQIREI